MNEFQREFRNRRFRFRCSALASFVFGVVFLVWDVRYSSTGVDLYTVIVFFCIFPGSYYWAAYKIWRCPRCDSRFSLGSRSAPESSRVVACNGCGIVYW